MSSERLLELMSGSGTFGVEAPKKFSERYNNLFDSPEPAAIATARRRGAEEASATLRKEFNEEVIAIQTDYQAAMSRLKTICCILEYSLAFD